MDRTTWVLGQEAIDRDNDAYFSSDRSMDMLCRRLLGKQNQKANETQNSLYRSEKLGYSQRLNIL
jgi:hypothetical protein